MTEGQKTALLIGGGVVALFLLGGGSKPRATVPTTVGYPSGTGGSTAAIVTGGVVSVVDTLTNALAGQQTSDASGSYYGY